jgi:hypothetical protein
VHSQRGKCCASVKFGAAAQRENQPFVQSAARIKGRIHRLQDKAPFRCGCAKVWFAEFNEAQPEVICSVSHIA